jgi:hypothetical protein
VEMRSMMWRTGFSIHMNNDPKKACNLWHELMIPQGTGLVYLLILEGLTPKVSRRQRRERSGRCWRLAPVPCSALFHRPLLLCHVIERFIHLRMWHKLFSDKSD